MVDIRIMPGPCREKELFRSSVNESEVVMGMAASRSSFPGL